jgi:hypothetical protein
VSLSCPIIACNSGNQLLIERFNITVHVWILYKALSYLTMQYSQQPASPKRKTECQSLLASKQLMKQLDISGASKRRVNGKQHQAAVRYQAVIATPANKCELSVRPRTPFP